MIKQKTGKCVWRLIRCRDYLRRRILLWDRIWAVGECYQGSNNFLLHLETTEAPVYCDMSVGQKSIWYIPHPPQPIIQHSDPAPIYFCCFSIAGLSTTGEPLGNTLANTSCFFFRILWPAAQCFTVKTNPKGRWTWRDWTGLVKTKAVHRPDNNRLCNVKKKKKMLFLPVHEHPLHQYSGSIEMNEEEQLNGSWLMSKPKTVIHCLTGDKTFITFGNLLGCHTKHCVHSKTEWSHQNRSNRKQ